MIEPPARAPPYDLHTPVVGQEGAWFHTILVLLVWHKPAPSLSVASAWSPGFVPNDPWQNPKPEESLKEDNLAPVRTLKVE